MTNETRTKEMWRSPCGKVVISTDGLQWIVREMGIYEEGNNIGDEYCKGTRFHYRLESAIECAARMLALKNAADLREFLEMHRATIEMLREYWRFAIITRPSLFGLSY